MLRFRIEDLPPHIQDQVHAVLARDPLGCNATAMRASETTEDAGFRDIAASQQASSVRAGGVKPKRAVREHAARGDKRGFTSLSPYADRLLAALQERFPERVQAEYRPMAERRFRIDMAFPAERVGIEFDGYRHHGFSRSGFRLGLERQNLLVRHGWRILRYTLTDVRDRLDRVMAEIEETLEAGNP